MKTMTWLNAGTRFAASLGIGVGLLLASCGHYTSEEIRSETRDWKTDNKDGRFTAAELTSLLSAETEVVGGKKFPKSKPTLKFVYGKNNVPEKFRAEHGVITAGAEMKGYLNMGAGISPVTQSRLVSNFEKISTWKTIKGPEDKVLFKDAFTTDATGKKIPDWSDGVAAETGEIHFATLSLDTGTAIGALAVPVKVNIYNRAGLIQADVANVADVRVPLVGTLIKAGNFKIYLKSFPQAKGWYVYGSAVVKMEKLEDSIKPEQLGTYVDSFFTWLKTNTVVSL